MFLEQSSEIIILFSTGCERKPRQGSTIGVGRVRTYAYIYWCTHNFGHAYVDMYADFFPYDFLKFSNFFWFIEFHTV